MNSNGRIQEAKGAQHSVRNLPDLIQESQELRKESRELRERNIHLLAGMQRRWLKQVRHRKRSEERKLVA